MKIVLILLLGCLLFSSTSSQTNTLNLPKDARVEGVIVDMKTKEAKNNELVIFRSQKNNNDYQTISDSSGKFFTRLPSGDKYDIFIMGFKDSIHQNILDIPSPGKNAYYKDAFKVNLEYDPPKSFVLNNVEFDFGKATLRHDSYATLNNLLEYLKRKPQVRIEIGGHTDNIGNDEKNIILSLKRAQAIVSYLESKGIGSNRLEAKGYGAAQPVEINDTEVGRQKNRRSEVKILE